MSAYDASIALLRTLAGPHGIHASSSSTANYRAIFTRDAVMAGIAGLLTRDTAIVAALVRTLEHLRDLQGPEGQIASNFEVREGAPPHVSFGTLAPRIDATTWYLIGVALAARANALDTAAYRDSATAVVRLLNALEYNGRDLVYVPTGGNWADEYVYDGYILYDQVLRAWALRLCAETFGELSWREKARRIEQRIEAAYWPPSGDAGDPPRRYPIASFTPVGARDVFDLAACSLLAAANVAPSIADAALSFVVDRFLARGELPPAFHPVIEEGDADWPALRAYHLHGFRNRPHEYHNGGVWPIWLGWLALGLTRRGRTADVERLRALLAERLGEQPAFAFEEYLHGLTSAPGGTRDMAYTATGFVFLHVASDPDALRLLS